MEIPQASAKIVIPARYASTRLPGKMLRNIAGVPLIVRTAKQAMQSGVPVLVAYDDERIGAVLRGYAIASMQTSEQHDNGTHRLSEVVTRCAWADHEIVVNVQGDEPLLPSAFIHRVVKCLQQDEHAAIATLATPLSTVEAQSPNIVKVVTTQQSRALYFSRACLPYVRDAVEGEAAKYLRHIGIYAYRVSALKQYSKLSPTPLEQCEKLEQLRFLEHGFTVAVAVMEEVSPPGVDSEEDIVRIENYYRQYKY